MIKLEEKIIPVVIQISKVNESFRDRCFCDVNGKTVLENLIGRLKDEYSSAIILATSDRVEDEVFDEIALQQNIGIYHGDYKNIISRLLGATEGFCEGHFIRVFANYPLLDIDEMKDLVKNHIEGMYEYSYNEHSEGVLWGTGCEVFSKKLLIKLNSLPLSDSQQETIGYYVRQNNHLYRVLRQHVQNNRPSYKMCLETLRDLEVIREVYANVSTISNCEIINYMSKHKVLSEYNVERPAEEVGTEKILLHPDKLQHLLKSDQIDMSYPVSVELSLTNLCNLHCAYCSDMELRQSQGIASQISLEVLKSLFDDLKTGGTKGIVLEGGGEPTIYAHFEEVVSYAKKIGLAVGLITNGTKALGKANLKEFEWIRVSLDATTGEEYKELKGIDRFETVLSNIADYAKYCKTVGVGFVVTNNNISQIENLVMRLRELHVSYIQLRPVVDCEELYPHGVDLGYLKCYETPEYAIEVHGMQENAASGNSSLSCRAHSITSVISADGSVYLCGRLNIYDWIPPIGNINKKKFYDIWNSEERAEQVRMVLDKEFCARNCPQCRISKFNQLFHRIGKIKSKHFI